uniref:Complement component 1, q subcomponent, A chain n=1 Tax=Nothobranchius korthausae TaxID=1143690 RepID=A0A1A8EZI2_9TELE
MAGFIGLVVLVGVAGFLSAVRCNPGCKGTDGHPGEAGSPGRDGLSGMKGEKGAPAVSVDGPGDQPVLLRLKGDRGSPGVVGPMGPKGFRGHVGASGLPGEPGPLGQHGRNIGAGQSVSQQEAQFSSFSVIRNDSTYPPFKKISFQSVVVNNPGDFNMTGGTFVCRIPGVYYFTFHSVAKVSMCLSLVADSADDKLTFCDYNSNRIYEHMLSGGAVLKLAANNKVWLESFQDEQSASDKQDIREKYIIFNGFLLFSNPE